LLFGDIEDDGVGLARKEGVLGLAGRRVAGENKTIHVAGFY
jgi:hypothetical protein